MRHLVLFFLLLLCLGKASADAVVTLCNVDNQPGVGLNLRDAVKEGGQITFACPPQTTLRITKVIVLNSAVEINGENNITLDGGDRNGIFLVKSDATVGIRYALWNLTIQRGKALDFRSRPFPHQRDLLSTIEIHLNSPDSEFILGHIKIINTEKPVNMSTEGSLTVIDSQFLTNTGPVLVVNGAVSFGHSRPPSPNLKISNSKFIQNHGAAFSTSLAIVKIKGAEVVGRGDATDNGSDFSYGNLNIHNSHFKNIWNGKSCGGALQSSSATTIENSSFSHNRSNCGGAIAFIDDPSMNVHLRAVTFIDNQTPNFGGAVLFEPIRSGEIQIRHGEFRNNRAGIGGAMYFSPRFAGFAGRYVDIKGTALSFKGNTATKMGSAIYVKDSNFQLTRGIFVDNESSTGGVIMFDGTNTPPFVIANSLIARNKNPIAIQATTGDIINSTIADNYGLGLSASGHLRLTNTVISNNKNQNCQSITPDGLIEDHGGNLQFPGDGCSGTIPVADPKLDNFYVPDLESPLQRAGINDVCLAPPVDSKDVYGQRRPRFDRCTIGAVEGDIEQMLHHIGITATKEPPVKGNGEGTEGSTEKGDGKGTKGGPEGKDSTVGIPMEWCLILLILIFIVLLILLLRKTKLLK